MIYPKISSPISKRSSDLLEDIAYTPDGGEISVGDLLKRLGDRSFMLAILVLSLPNSLPLPGIPGLSTVTGLPILFMAVQIICGRKAIWLPRKVALKRFHQEFLTKVIHKALPALLWLEQFIRPRWTALCESIGEKAIGFLIAVMAFILALPIMGANFLPGVSISLLALALLEKDGLLAAAAIVFSAGSLYFMYEVIVVAGGEALRWMCGLL